MCLQKCFDALNDFKVLGVHTCVIMFNHGMTFESFMFDFNNLCKCSQYFIQRVLFCGM